MIESERMASEPEAHQKRLAEQGLTRYSKGKNKTKARMENSNRKLLAWTQILHKTQTTTTPTCENYHKLINESSRVARCMPPRPKRTTENASRRHRRARACDSYKPTQFIQLHKRPSPMPPSRHPPGLRLVGAKMLRLIRWPLVHLCLPLCLTLILMLAIMLALPTGEGCATGPRHQLITTNGAAPLLPKSTTHEEPPTRTSQSMAQPPPSSVQPLPDGGPLALSSKLLEPTTTAALVPVAAATNGPSLGKF